jgi:hypothetical protein
MSKVEDSWVQPIGLESQGKRKACSDIGWDSKGTVGQGGDVEGRTAHLGKGRAPKCVGGLAGREKRVRMRGGRRNVIGQKESY